MRRRLKVQLVALFGICVAAYAWNVVSNPGPQKDPLPQTSPLPLPGGLPAGAALSPPADGCAVTVPSVRAAGEPAG